MYPMYGPPTRPMPPPSPQHSQHFGPRYSQPQPPPPPIVNPFNYSIDSRAPPQPHKRPGSSMSISSMLGSEPERPPTETYYNHHPQAQPQQHTTHGPNNLLGAVMSPPQYPPKPAMNDYNYKGRSHTPDQFGENTLSNRYRSSSGTMMQRPGPFYEPHHGPSDSIQAPRYPDYNPPKQHMTSASLRDEVSERARRTSINGILHRPESQPQRPAYNPLPGHLGGGFERPTSAVITPLNGHGPAATTSIAEHQPAATGSYDTRPPPFMNPLRPTQPTPPKALHPFSESRDRGSLSPDTRRLQPQGPENRSLAGILNHPDPAAAHSMVRQDSVQSQSERSAFGDRWRPRPFSPFTGSVASQSLSGASALVEDQTRKGSDELSQHRTILGLAAESKRGRYSPVPQAVQGAQAQTPVPDAAIKNEHGRVFAGLGGLGTGSSGPTSTPGPLAASPFRQNDGPRLSEENLMKISRSASGVSKKSRRLDDGIRAESEAGDGKKAGRSNKKSKYAHSYKLDLEESQRRGTSLATLNGVRNTSTPANVTSNPQTLHHHHQLQRQVPSTTQALSFKPRKTIRMTSVMAAAKRLKRRHIGNFRYNPQIGSTEGPNTTNAKFDVSVRPNLLPSFSGTNQVNCTYSVRVPSLWLQKRERRLICKECYLWGSGIYTDDSDVVAAAMHSGFINSVPPESIDEVLLQRVISTQNTKVEGLVDPPTQPSEPDMSKDAMITLVVLPNLYQYPGSSRFGICSRTWPENAAKTEHDGVSFAILSVEYITGGFESRRMGRTGREKRARLRRELQARERDKAAQQQMVEKARKKLSEQKKVKTLLINTAVSKSVAKASMTKEPAVVTTETTLALDSVGQAPGEWLRQLAVSAVD